MSHSLVRFAGLAIVVTIVSACSSNPKVDEGISDAPAAAFPITRSARGPMVTFEDVLFDFEEATLRDEANAMLEQTTDYLLEHPGRDAIIEGHTDRIGDVDYNQWLSNLRAESVRDELIELGVPASRIRTRGLGELHPVADNDTADGRQTNRRVEIVFAQSGQQL